MAAFDTSVLTTHPLDYRLYGSPVMYLRREHLEEDAAALANDGYEVVRIDGSSWVVEEDVHTSIAQSLGFPNCYGRNLDALNDCLGDVASYEYGTDRAATGTLILLDNVGRFAAASPEVSAAVVGTFAGAVVNAMAFGHRMLVLLKMDDPDIEVRFRGGSAAWNPREWLDSKRILPD